MKTKSKKVKTVSPTGWYRYRFYLPSPRECNLMAWPLAKHTRKHHLSLYFARYTAQKENRIDLFVNSPAGIPLLNFHSVFNRHQVFCVALLGPTPCEGSLVHAEGFNYVWSFMAAKDANGEAASHQWCDVLHWMSNMLGLDYLDEMNNYLYMLQRFTTILRQLADNHIPAEEPSQAIKISWKDADHCEDS